MRPSRTVDSDFPASLDLLGWVPVGVPDPSPDGSPNPSPDGTLDRAGYQVVFEEDFTGPALAADRWITHYLPHWSTPERSAARYDLDVGVLRLRIDADQPPWLPEGDQLRVSNIQTGSFSGPVGSERGTHRHRPDLPVRTAQPTRRLYTPSTGLVEARLRATADLTCMLAVLAGWV